MSNILLNATTLKTYSEGFTRSLIYEASYNVPLSHAQESYATLGNTIGPLGTTPAIIAMQYLCQVPVHKTAGSMFIAILILDLVFI
jgi:hypothetical protein